MFRYFFCSKKAPKFVRCRCFTPLFGHLWFQFWLPKWFQKSCQTAPNLFFLYIFNMCFHTSLWAPLLSTSGPLLAPKGIILKPFDSHFGHFLITFGTPDREKKLPEHRLDVWLILAILDTSLRPLGQKQTKTILLKCLSQSAHIKNKGAAVSPRVTQLNIEMMRNIRW